MPKFTVIIQGWQDRGFFDESINSVLNQDFDDFEVILSSDGNADLKKYADKYGIKFSLSSKENHSASVNEAISKSSGEIIKVLDDDDLLPEGALQNVWDNRGDVMHGDALLLKGNDTHYFHGKNVDVYKLLPLITNPINWATFYFTREVWDKIGGFDRKVHFANDYDFYLNCLRHGYKIKLISELIGCYRYHDAQMSKMCTYFKPNELVYLKDKYKDFIYQVMRQKINDDLGCPL